MRRLTLGGDKFWTADALAADLAGLGLAAGEAVMVHASLRAVGPVLGGADGVITALRRVVGPQGCILAYVSWLEQFEDALDEDGRLDPAMKPFIPPFDAATSRANPDMAGSPRRFARRRARGAAAIPAHQWRHWGQGRKASPPITRWIMVMALARHSRGWQRLAARC